MPQTITDIIARVAYPIECELQDKEEELQQRFFPDASNGVFRFISSNDGSGGIGRTGGTATVDGEMDGCVSFNTNPLFCMDLETSVAYELATAERQAS